MTLFQIQYTKLGRINARINGRSEQFSDAIYPTYEAARSALAQALSVPNPIQSGVRVRVDINRNRYTESAGSGIVNQNAKMHSIDAIMIRKIEA